MNYAETEARWMELRRKLQRGHRLTKYEWNELFWLGGKLAEMRRRRKEKQQGLEIEE